MRSVGIMCACAILGWLAKRREPDESEPLAPDILATINLVAGTMPKRVTAWSFPTLHGQEIGWRVKAHCVEEAAEIMSQSPVFGRVA